MDRPFFTSTYFVMNPSLPLPTSSGVTQVTVTSVPTLRTVALCGALGPVIVTLWSSSPFMSASTAVSSPF